MGRSGLTDTVGDCPHLSAPLSANPGIAALIAGIKRLLIIVADRAENDQARCVLVIARPSPSTSDRASQRPCPRPDQQRETTRVSDSPAYAATSLPFDRPLAPAIEGADRDNAKRCN